MVEGSISSFWSGWFRFFYGTSPYRAVNLVIGRLIFFFSPPPSRSLVAITSSLVNLIY